MTRAWAAFRYSALWSNLADFVAEVGDRDGEAAAWVLANVLVFCERSTWETHHWSDCGYEWSRKTCIERWRRSGDQLDEPAKILRNRRQRELKLSTAWPAQP